MSLEILDHARNDRVEIALAAIIRMLENERVRIGIHTHDRSSAVAGDHVLRLSRNAEGEVEIGHHRAARDSHKRFFGKPALRFIDRARATQFGIDQVQAEFVAEIKLRNINKEYILKRTAETGDLEREIQELEATLNSDRRIRSLIIKELEQVSKKFGQPRKTELLYHWDAASGEEPEEELPDYPVTAFVSREGYFKKITPQSLRASGEQKFKEGDGLAFAWETTNRAELLVFTDQFQCYKARLSDFDDGKASQLGDYLPTKLSMDPGENVVQTVFPGDYSGFVLFFFESGKVAKVPLSSYDTKSNRRKLTGAYSDKSPLRTVSHRNIGNRGQRQCRRHGDR